MNNLPGQSGSQDTQAEGQEEFLHPAAPFVALFVAVAVGRLQEIVPILQPLQLGKLTLVAAILAVIFSKKATNAVLRSPLGIRVFLFSLLAIVSLSYSIWGTGTLRFLELDLLRIFLLFVLIYKTAVNTKTIQFYVYTLASLLALMVIVGLLAQSAARTSFSDTYDSNDVGLVVLTLSAFLYGISRDKSIRLRLPLFVLSLAGFAVVLSTQSRGAFLGLCAVVFFFLIARENPGGGRLYRMPNLRILFGVAVSIFVVLLIAPAESWDRIFTIFELESDYNTSTERGRVAIWERGISAFSERPWGVGGGAYQAADMRAGGSYMTAHNSILQVTVELGVLGLFLYLGFIRKTWQYSAQLLRGPAHDKAIADSYSAFGLGLRGAITGFLVSGFFLSMAYGRLFYVILALAAAAETVWLAEPVATPSKRRHGKTKLAALDGR